MQLSPKGNEVTLGEKTESAMATKKRKERCPFCGSNKWIGKPEDYILHYRCQRCGFESKEIATEWKKQNAN